MSSSIIKTSEIRPLQTLRGHTSWVNSVVHLHAGRQAITCSVDGSLRLWDIESGTQIGEDWRDEDDEAEVWSMALSPNGKTIASGCSNGKVKLWDVETRKVIAKWPGHINVVGALCWSGDDERVLSGSWDGTARVRDVESSQTVLTIKTGHQWVNAVIFSPDAAKIVTGGHNENAVKIWDVKTGGLLNTLKHDNGVWSLAWTVDAITLSQNNRLLCASDYQTVRLWNLDTNLPVGPPLQHGGDVECAALSADGKLLVTGCKNGNAYVWDIQAILREAGLEHLLPPASDVMLMVF
ncbi:WD40 repeat-like protein [Suillus hirtellus]|nr:WD40 repeat-like protein [Suillus hirtellus]